MVQWSIKCDKGAFVATSPHLRFECFLENFGFYLP